MRRNWNGRNQQLYRIAVRRHARAAFCCATRLPVAAELQAGDIENRKGQRQDGAGEQAFDMGEILAGHGLEGAGVMLATA